jgi:hypothetical protein
MLALVRVVPRNTPGDAESENIPWTTVTFTGDSIQLDSLPPGHFYEVRFSPQDSLETLSQFSPPFELAKIEIPVSLECFPRWAFNRCRFLTDLHFAPHGYLKILQGFHFCHSLTKIEIPASVEVITGQAFHVCKSLCQVIFAPGSRLKELYGFQFCYSLPRIILPASLKIIERNSFGGCISVCEAVFESESSLDAFWAVDQFQTRDRIEVLGNFQRLNEKHPNSFRGLRLLRRTTEDGQWSLLLRASKDCYLTDEAKCDIARIPEIVIDRGESFEISGISDRLLVLCASRSISIPRFIRCIRSSFGSIEDCVRILEIAASIEIVEGFLQVK